MPMSYQSVPGMYIQEEVKTFHIASFGLLNVKFNVDLDNTVNPFKLHPNIFHISRPCHFVGHLVSQYCKPLKFRVFARS